MNPSKQTKTTEGRIRLAYGATPKPGPNARFWTTINNSPVKITLKPDETLEWGRTEPTNEGYSHEGLSFSHDDGIVVCEAANGGRDCDGVLYSYSTLACPREQLARRLCTENGLLFPAWKQVNADQYDQYAQAANY
jgi:hypothetical protein